MGTLTLRLDTVQVEPSGYGTATKGISTKRSYPCLLYTSGDEILRRKDVSITGDLPPDFPRGRGRVTHCHRHSQTDLPAHLIYGGMVSAGYFQQSLSLIHI